jgi:hypothetical protein
MWVYWQELPQQPGVAHSQPFRSGGVWLQSERPGLHAYAHVVPLHLGVPDVVSQTFPQPPQFAVVVALVSQPLRSGAVVVQFAQPGAHP